MADSDKRATVRGRQGYSVSDKGGGGAGGRSPVLLIGGALAAVAAIAVIVGFAAVIGNPFSSGPDYNAGLKAGDCTAKLFGTDKGGDHIQANEKALPKWDSDPPTHGKHDPVWSIWGSYDQEIAQEKLVHNLEHAGLVIQYGPKVPAGELTKLKDAIASDHEWIVIAPYSKLGDRIAYESWTRLTTCKRFNGDVLTHFKALRNKPGGSAESDAFPNGRDWSQEERQPGW